MQLNNSCNYNFHTDFVFSSVYINDLKYIIPNVFK